MYRLVPVVRNQDDWGMKYWILFTLRTIARAGLLLAVLAWCLPVSGIGSGPVPSYRVTVGWGSMGWHMYWMPPGSGSVWTYHIGGRGDSAEVETEFDRVYPSQTAFFPGATYCQGPNPPSLLRFRHWLVCLTFLIATILTSWRWKRPRAVIEGTDA